MDRKTALQTLWQDRCTILVREKTTDPITHITQFEQKALYEDLPCKLSFESLSTTGEGAAPAITQSAKLFLEPEITVPPGSKIQVQRKGKMFSFARSGQAGVFSGHQEIPLALWERWA